MTKKISVSEFKMAVAATSVTIWAEMCKEVACSVLVNTMFCGTALGTGEKAPRASLYQTLYEGV